MEVNIIFACGANEAFGYKNALPWHEPDDLKYFKQLTKGYAVIMGRNTWESLPDKRRPLPGRDNFVVSTSKDGKYFVDSIEEALRMAKEKNNKKAFIIGGATMIASSMSFADNIYRNIIPYEGPFDVLAPAIDSDNWKLKRTDLIPNDRGDDFITVEKWVKRNQFTQKFKRFIKSAKQFMSKEV